LNEDKSARYQRVKRTVTWIWLAVGVVAIAALLPARGSILLRDAIVRITGAGSTSLATVMLFGVALVMLSEVVGFPLTLYQRRLERRYGMSHQPLSTELVSDVKSLPVAAAFIALHAAAVYLALEWWPSWWWLISAGIFTVILFAITILAPVVTPIFFTCKPIDRPDLRTRLEALAARVGVSGLSVYEWTSDAGARRSNAALVGIGRGRRVLLSDTLLSDYTHDEIEVIVAHELGHHVHGDIRTAFLLRAAVALIVFAAAATALNRFWQPLGLEGPNDAAGMPLLLVAGGMILILARPFLNALSRRKEYRADRFALTLTGRLDAFVSAMRRLAAQHLQESYPSVATVWLFHSHPTVEQRIQAAKTLVS